MTATLIKEIEGAPTNLLAWPGAWAPADNLDAERAAWARIEAYTAVRYTSRTIVWVVEGPGDWEPPLRPATITTTERWTGSAFETVALDPSPRGGYSLPGEGPYRFSGTVGAGTPPQPVIDAWVRLAQYLAQIGFDDVGVRSSNVDGVASFEYAPPSYRALALQNSGAADLLRAYRRV
jgi:hypothetical protein